MSEWNLVRCKNKDGFYIKDNTNRPLFYIEPLGSGEGDLEKIAAADAMYEALTAISEELWITDGMDARLEFLMSEALALGEKKGD